jgi:hypothetical protein
MRKVIVTTNPALDQVMQAPGNPGQNVGGGFTRSRWALPRHRQGQDTGDGREHDVGRSRRGAEHAQKR